MHNNETGADAKITWVKVKAVKVAQIIGLEGSKEQKGLLPGGQQG